VAGRKQVSFEGTLYRGNGSRRLGDIDLLIRPGDAAAATEALNELGFEAVQYDWVTDEIVPIPRREMMIYRLSPDHLPIMIQRTGDQITRFLDVDCATSLTWSKSEYEVPVDEVLATVSHQPVPGVPEVSVPVVAPEHEVIGTALHLFREAWFERWLNWEQDVDLAKFGDMIRLWRAHAQEIDAIRGAIDRYGVREPVLWVLEHMDRTFHTDSVATLGLEGEVDETWLASAHSSSGEPRRFRGTMRERLHTKDRKALFGGQGENHA
ncbi:MAG: nucleotidyltransferase family protein, partial [Acidobacteriota bacterium]